MGCASEEMKWFMQSSVLSANYVLILNEKNKWKNRLQCPVKQILDNNGSEINVVERQKYYFWFVCVD